MPGPFKAIDTSIREVQGAQLQGGAVTGGHDSALAEAVSGIIQGGGALLSQYQGQRREAQKQATLAGAQRGFSDLTLDLMLQRHPSLRQSDLFTADGVNNPVVGSAMNGMSSIAEARDAGALTDEQAMVRMELALRKAIDAAPEYRAELTQLAKDSFGFLPTEKMAAYLAEPSPEEKAAQQLATEAAKYGLAPQQYQLFMQNRLRAEAELQWYDLEKKKGNYNANIVGSQAAVQLSALNSDIWATLEQANKAGGVQDKVALQNQVRATVDAARARLMANMPANADPSIIQGHLDKLNQMEATWIRGIEDNSALNLLTQMNDTTRQQVLRSMENIDGMTEAYYIFGNNGAANLVAGIALAEANPSAFAAAAKSGHPAANATQLSLKLSMLRDGVQFYKTEEGKMAIEPRTPQERDQAILIGAQVLEAPGLEPERVTSVLTRFQEITDSKDVDIVMLTKPKVIPNIVADKDVHPAIVNTYNAQLVRLTNQYAELTRSKQLPKEALRIENGMVAAPTGTVVQATGYSYSGAEITGKGSQQFEEWRKNMNRFLKFGAVYNKAGIVPSTIFGGADGVLQHMQSTVTEALTKEAQAKEPATAPEGAINFYFDSNGELVIKE